MPTHQQQIRGYARAWFPDATSSSILYRRYCELPLLTVTKCVGITMMLLCGVFVRCSILLILPPLLELFRGPILWILPCTLKYFGVRYSRYCLCFNKYYRVRYSVSGILLVLQENQDPVLLTFITRSISTVGTAYTPNTRGISYCEVK